MHSALPYRRFTRRARRSPCPPTISLTAGHTATRPRMRASRTYRHGGVLGLFIFIRRRAGAIDGRHLRAGVVDRVRHHDQCRDDGNGFFPVRDSLDGGDVYYTRNGEFSVDSDGYLTNGGFYLLGWRTDAAGNATSRMLEPIDVNSIASTAAATTEVAIKANLPADAAVNATFNTTIDLYNSLGGAHSMEITWTKTAENAWRADFADPTLAANSSSVSGDVTSGPITITFNPDGTLLSATTTPPRPLSRSRSAAGRPAPRTARSPSISVKRGCDRADPVRVGPGHTRCRPQLAVAEWHRLRKAAKRRDRRYGGGDRLVQQRPADLAFQNSSRNLQQPERSVRHRRRCLRRDIQIRLHRAARIRGRGCRQIQGGALEASTTDTSEEFTSIIAAQQAYSAAAQIITTVDKMFETLIASVR